MNMKIKSLCALAAFAAAAFSAHAQLDAGDLILGFRSTAASSDVEIGLGNVNSLTTGLIGNFNASLTSVFGSSWATTGGISWGAAGTDNVNTIDYVTAKWNTAAGTLGVQNSTPFAAASSSALGLASSAIVVAGQGFTGPNAVAAADANAITIAKSNAQSWTSQETAGSAAFGSSAFAQSTFSNTTNRSNASVGASASDLYEYTANNAGVFLGTFSLKSNGDLYFTAIPEPSTYAAILGVATLGIAMIRRRKQAVAA